MSDHIYNEVMEAMQQAEEIDGPDTADCIVLMTRIINECATRIQDATEVYVAPNL